jgi:hypothetical protein
VGQFTCFDVIEIADLPSSNAEDEPSVDRLVFVTRV